MVAISLYRGDLHRVPPETPRRWPVPRPTITLPQFRRLLRNRALALSRQATADAAVAAAAAAAAVSEPKDNDSSATEEKKRSATAAAGDEQEPNATAAVAAVAAFATANGEVKTEEVNSEVVTPKKEEGEVEEEEERKDVVLVDADGGGLEGKLEGSNNASVLTGIEEKKKELETKLDALNEKKHNLVQMLKQILNAEEEIKRRSMQSMLRASMPPQPEIVGDGSFAARPPPRMTVEVNFGDVAGESDAGSNQCTPGRQLHYFHSTSPSAASFARSPFGSVHHNSGYTPRSPAAFAMASPSRFAANGHQVHAPNHPSVAPPGGSFVASSPSPAASGGSSSVFRDSRPPSST